MTEIAECTCLAVLALLDPCPGAQQCSGDKAVHPRGEFSPVSIHTAEARTQEEVLVVLNALFERLKGEMFAPTVYWKSRAVWLPAQPQGPHSVMKVCTQGRAGAYSVPEQPSLLWDRNHSVLDLQPPTTTLTLPPGLPCLNNSVITPPSTHPGITTCFSQVFSKCNLCVLYLSLIDQADVFLFWTNSHYI